MVKDKKDQKEAKKSPGSDKRTKVLPKSPGIKPFPKGQEKAPASAKSPTSGGASTGANPTLAEVVAAKKVEEQRAALTKAQGQVSDPSLDRSLLSKEEAELLKAQQQQLDRVAESVQAVSKEYKASRKQANRVMRELGEPKMFSDSESDAEGSSAGSSKRSFAAVAGSAQPALSTVGEEEEQLLRPTDGEPEDMDISSAEEEELLASEPQAPAEPAEIDETTGWPKGFRWYAKDQFAGYWQRFIEIPKQKRWLISFNDEGKPVYVRNPGQGNPNMPPRMRATPELNLRLQCLPYGISKAGWEQMKAEKEAAKERRRLAAAEAAARKAALEAAREQEELQRKAQQYDLLSGQFGEIMARLERQEEENRALRAAIEAQDPERGRAKKRERPVQERTQDRSQSSKRGGKKKRKQPRKTPQETGKPVKVDKKKSKKVKPKKEAPKTAAKFVAPAPQSGPSGAKPVQAGPSGQKPRTDKSPQPGPSGVTSASAAKVAPAGPFGQKPGAPTTASRPASPQPGPSGVKSPVASVAPSGKTPESTTASTTSTSSKPGLPSASPKVVPAGPFGKNPGMKQALPKPKRTQKPHYTQPEDPKAMTPKNTLLQKVLVDESFESTPVIPTYLCLKCGKAGHKKDQCRSTVRCRYANCVQKGRANLHNTYVCPWIMAKCDYCQMRGHPKNEGLCAQPRDALVSRFEQVADDHVLTRWRRACYNWGIHIFPNRATMLRVQEDYSYEHVAGLTRRKFLDLL